MVALSHLGMTRRKRRIVFWLAVAVVIAAVPLIIGYARGYRFDPKSLKITQVGAIFVDSRPTDASVFLDGENTGKKTAALIGNLFPYKNYSIEIKKEGFRPWRKKLLAEPSKITRAEQIILPPEKFTPENAFSTTTAFDELHLSASGQLGLGVRKGTAGGINLYLLDLADKTLEPIVFPDKLVSQGIGGIEWSRADGEVIFARETRSGRIWYRFRPATTELTNLNLVFASNLKPEKIKFAPSGDLFFLIDGKVISTNPRFATSSARNFEFGDDRIFALNASSSLLELDLAGKLIEDHGFLEIEPFALKVSPDNKKIAYFDDNKIGVIWLADAAKDPFYKRGDREIIFKSENRIKSMWWQAGSEHFLAYLEGGAMVFGELDGRGGRNIWEWELDDRSLSYVAKQKALWFLNSQGFLVRESKNF